jgi:hypothetical protein
MPALARLPHPFEGAQPVVTADADRPRFQHGEGMEAATLSARPHDRVCNWFDELKRVAADVPTLPPAARRAVSSVLLSLRPEVEPDLTSVQTQRLDEVLAALSGR